MERTGVVCALTTPAACCSVTVATRYAYSATDSSWGPGQHPLHAAPFAGVWFACVCECACVCSCVWFVCVCSCVCDWICLFDYENALLSLIAYCLSPSMTVAPCVCVLVRVRDAANSHLMLLRSTWLPFCHQVAHHWIWLPLTTFVLQIAHHWLCLLLTTFAYFWLPLPHRSLIIGINYLWLLLSHRSLIIGFAYFWLPLTTFDYFWLLLPHRSLIIGFDYRLGSDNPLMWH